MACVMTVCALFGQTHWTQPTNYLGSVTANSVLVIDGVESVSDQIEIGAFCGDECRGAALPYGILVEGHRLYFLSIGGNTNNEVITFRLWDHETDQELEYDCQTTVTFTDNQQLGTYPDWFEISFTSPVTTVDQTIALASGTNWVSTNVDITLADLQTALVTALPSATNIVIKTKVGTSSYSTTYNGSRWRGNLTASVFNVTLMYQVVVLSDCEITLTGMPINPADHPVTIVPGVNWIGYQLGTSDTPANIFAGFAFSGDVIKTKVGGTYSTTYNGTKWRGSLTNLEPGCGYIYQSAKTEIREFVFP